MRITCSVQVLKHIKKWPLGHFFICTSRGGTSCDATAGRGRMRKDVSGGQSPRGFSSRNASCGSSCAGSNFRRGPCAEGCWRFPAALPGYPGSTPVLCIRCHCRCSWEHPHSGRRCRWSGSGGRRSGSRSSNFFDNDFSYSHHPIWIGASPRGALTLLYAPRAFGVPGAV